MQLKPIIRGLGVVWLLLFVVSFVSLRVTEADGSMASGLGRIVSFLTWQTAALVVAAIGAFATRYATQRGVEGLKLFGYMPLALSVFLVASFVALVAFRIYVAPLFE